MTVPSFTSSPTILCLHGGIKNREGYGRTVENNIMVGSGLHPHVWFAASGDIFRRNIVWRDYQPAIMPPPALGPGTGLQT